MVNKKIASELAVGTVLLAALAVGGIFWMENRNSVISDQSSVIDDQNSDKEEEKIQQASEDGVVSSTETGRKHEPVIIYSEEIKTTEDNSRSWPTVHIYRKIGSQQPEMLAEVGKVGEFPNDYSLSSDEKNLLINLESKLQILNLKTKELSDLFVPRKSILGFTFSPDDKKLFIWDQKYASHDKDYFVHILDLETKSSKIISQGKNSLNPLFPGVWRDDNKVTLAEAFGEFSIQHYFDLSNNKISKAPKILQAGPLSRDGKIMISSNGSLVEDVCNGFSGSGPSSYDVIDPINGKIFGKVGVEGMIVGIFNISPNNDAVILAAHKPWVNAEDCEKEIVDYFYLANISTGRTEKILNLSEILNSWGVEHVGAKYDYDKQDASLRSILLDGELLVGPSKDLRIISQFYN